MRVHSVPPIQPLRRNRWTTLVGERLRQARRRRGWTLEEAAAASGGRAKATTLGSYERGDRQITIDVLFDLAALYCVHAQDLLPCQRSPDDIELVEKLARLSSDRRALVEELVEELTIGDRLG